TCCTCRCADNTALEPSRRAELVARSLGYARPTSTVRRRWFPPRPRRSPSTTSTSKNRLRLALGIHARPAEAVVGQASHDDRVPALAAGECATATQLDEHSLTSVFPSERGGIGGSGVGLSALRDAGPSCGQPASQALA